MKTLSADLLAAQQDVSGEPWIEAQLLDYHGERRRFRPVRYYTGNETDNFIAVVAAADGSIVRARSVSNTIEVSRVTSPGSGSTWSSWTLVSGVSDLAQIALCREGDNLLLFYVHTDDRQVRFRTSTNHGASWSGSTTIATASNDVIYLAAAIQGDGDDRLVLWSEGADVYRSRFDGSSWGARTAWTPTAASITGLAVVWNSDFQVIVCGTETTTTHPKVWAVRYGDGFAATADVWGTLRTVNEADAGSDVSFSVPAVTLLDGQYHLLYVESFAGDTAYERVQYATKDTGLDFDQEDWREALPFDYEGNAYGVAVTTKTLALWIAAVDGVWEATPLASLDVSARVLEADVRTDGGGSRATLVLDNEDGALTAYGTGTTYAVLRRGARLELSPGMKTEGEPDGERAGTLPYAYWVEEIELQTGPRPRLLLRARGAELLLERWRARRQFSWAAATLDLAQLTRFLLSRAGLDYGGGSQLSDLWSGFEPAFTVHPGESGATALARLLAKAPELALWDGGNLKVHDPRDDDASVYTLGAGHAILRGRYLDTGPEVNRGRAIGTDVLGEAFDFDEIAGNGERLRTAVDANLATEADAADVAAALLRRAEIEARADELEIFGVHCGVELYDVVAVTDAAAGLSGAGRRVLGYRWRFGPGLWSMSLRLGQV